ERRKHQDEQAVEKTELHNCGILSERYRTTVKGTENRVVSHSRSTAPPPCVRGAAEIVSCSTGVGRVSAAIGRLTRSCSAKCTVWNCPVILLKMSCHCLFDGIV